MLETKLRINRLATFMNRKFRGWKFVFNHEQVEGGRILVIWNHFLVDCVPLNATSQVMHCHITDKVTSHSFLCSFIYGLHSISDKRDIWNSLLSWGINHNELWIILGDFNSIFSPNERRGGVTPNVLYIEDFLSCATTLGLEDVGSTGSFYTWTNGTIWTKLDRALINPDWHASNLNCYAEFLPFNSLLDHAPMVVSLNPTIFSRDKPFRFLNMWMSHPNFSTNLCEV